MDNSMKNPQQRPVIDLFADKNLTVNKLIERAHEIASLHEKVHQFLDPIDASHVKVGQYYQGILILLADSPSFASKLRYSVPNLLSNLRQQSEWCGLKSIEIKVRSFNENEHLKLDEQEHTIDIQISSETAYKLRDLSDMLGDDADSEKLKEALTRLARHETR